MLPMTLDPAKLLDDIATLKKMLDVEHAARIASDKRAAEAEARANGLEVEVRSRADEIEALKLTIAKLKRNTFGASSESGRKLLDQLELQLAELEESMAEDKTAAEITAPHATADKQHQKPARRPVPAHLPRERIVQTPLLAQGWACCADLPRVRLLGVFRSCRAELGLSAAVLRDVS